jgi:AcrR family transcriptional regulator
MARLTSMSDQVRHRRRGEELENALLTAAWDELVDTGFVGLTMESVAARAQTGVAVLYRRWSNKDELVLAAIEHYRRTGRPELPDTGSLRDDLVAVLSSVSDGRTTFSAVVSAVFAGLAARSGLTPAELRDQVFGAQTVMSDFPAYHRAHERGEIDLDRVPPAVLSMPFDLVRHDVLMTNQPVPPERITAIVDDLFMPLATASLSRARETTRRP